MDLNSRLSRLTQIALRARYSFDIWWVYEGRETRPKYQETMNRFVDFFRFDILAHQISHIVHLSQLYETRKDTLNLRSVLREAKREGVEASVIEQSETAFAASDATRNKVAILRSNVFAHRSPKLAFSEVFELAAVTPNELRELTEIALKTLNPLLAARGMQTWEHCPDAHEDTIKMLDALLSVS